MRTLILDIETAPNIAYVWGAWKNNVGKDQWLDHTYIMSFAAKWLGEDEIMYMECRDGKDRSITSTLYKLLDEADMVVAHNGLKFDFPVIRARGVQNKLSPPSPFFQYDTVKVARREFRFVQNSLAMLCKLMDLPEKQDHKKFPGFKLWEECLKGNEEAWEEMREYNVADVVSLEALYLRMRPYDRHHPNIASPTGEALVACPKCGGHHIQWRGYHRTPAGIDYPRFQCQSCFGWGRASQREKDLAQNKGRNAV